MILSDAVAGAEAVEAGVPGGGGGGVVDGDVGRVPAAAPEAPQPSGRIAPLVFSGPCASRMAVDLGWRVARMCVT